MNGYYNSTVFLNPLLDSVFPEFKNGKLYKIVSTSNISQYDVPLLCAAKDQIKMLNDIAVDMLDDENNLNVEISYNDRYLSNKKPLEEVVLDTNNNVFIKPMFAYNREDFILSESLLRLGDNVLAGIATVTNGEPISLDTRFTMH